jgi:uncharacterized protein (TIGR02646 family)
VIGISRGSVPPDLEVFTAKSTKALDGVTRVTKAELEIQKAAAFFTDSANYANEEKLTEKSFKFSVYKDPELVIALETVFGTKCAYCEGHFGAVTPKDVEHFRPKSEIDTGAGVLRPGYYWLACEWENLLLSCPDCNRPRKHEIPGQAAKAKLGKETQFPLADEARRIRSHGQLIDEEGVRLLLNPCCDQPEEHLTFDEKGLVHARPDAGGAPSRMGEVSITVYALQRKGLVEERLRVLNQFRLNVGLLNHLVKLHNDLAAGAAKADNADQIRRVTTALQGMLVSGAPYLAMLREWIRLGKDRGDFDNLVQFGIDLADLI